MRDFETDDNAMRIARDESFLLLIDIQERLVPAVHAHDSVVRRCEALVRAARHLGVPVLATEHCPERIGPTVASLRTLLEAGELHAKRFFACTDEPGIAQAIERLGRRQPVVAGMEAHVCALQSTLGLAEHGLQPYFVADAAGSRHPGDHALALARLSARGVSVVSAEMVMFEWLRHADDPAFRDVLRIVKG